MSADNWGNCPKCKVYPPTYKYVENSLREDYEIGIEENGYFYVEYAGKCDDCGFSFHFELQERVELVGEDGD
jgi:Fe-S cluster biogenesis protein NfuA